MWRRVCVVGLVVLAISGVAGAGTTDIPRILLVGDSWGAFMQLLRSIDAVRPEVGWTGIGQRGHRTTLVGARAFLVNDPDPSWYERLPGELADYPTIDIVHLSLGGNDFVLDTDWNPSMTEQQITDRINAIVAQISSTIDTILAIRPNIRVALCGYDFGNHDVDDMSPATMNAIMVQYERARKDMVLAKGSRVFYVHNLGMMQYYYGITQATPPIAAGVVPFPGGYAQNYVPFPGGDPAYNSPLESLMDDDMHLTIEGYDYVAKRCFDEIYTSWLSWPVVYEILPLTDAKSPVQSFRVTFSKSVTGVDITDFTAGGVTGATVAAVTGTGSVYTVDVDLHGGSGTATLAVTDDDTIVDAGLLPLGGSGTGNGGFSANGEVQYADPELAGSDDFDGTMWSLSRAFTAVSWMLSGQQFDPDHCDANGGSIEVNPPAITGNNMLDSAELAIVYECLHNESLNLSASGGVTHAQVAAAYTQNHTQILSDLGGEDGRALLSVPGLDIMMAGFMTLGDSGSSMIPVLLMTAVGKYIAFPGVTTPDLMDYDMSLSAYLGPDGDADGDGATNREEYTEFYTSGGREAYVAAALNPTITPPSCTNSEGGTFDEGEAFCLGIPGEFNVEGGFQWYHNDEPVENNARITGAHTRDLHISSLKAADAGQYECVYDNETKHFGTVTIGVISHTPAAGTMGLAALCFILVVGGIAALRRRLEA